ncbi:mRNA-binding ubiquitin-specific protease UBP3 [Spizellomyces punctatus DAOM BR117]|uniref:Ubiquitin carboxyl-terminal hydrolase n=1 Tax=Spizellomyces punctatus (strain DAOM BR117) TaxID=645134 RepID=A0A0L0H7W3_SPIPD|nr:mRNA-binding ubiquitin-specific protease UBP3 [Spizellomyces punctatus DAOM BR117]KNC97016.1 hypothetical protein SPPG_07831 [Spizellomyces punctatus DAOM BR117]|eukprot:XP_016605056.1 hypothetical protein SPPG_07831 [Spizellomyces punctatus DAOM BR117]
MFSSIRFGDLSPADIAKVIDASSLVPYQPRWSPPDVSLKRPSIVFGSIVVIRSPDQAMNPALSSPVVIGPASSGTTSASLKDLDSIVNSGAADNTTAFQSVREEVYHRSKSGQVSEKRSTAEGAIDTVSSRPSVKEMDGSIPYSQSVTDNSAAIRLSSKADSSDLANGHIVSEVDTTEPISPAVEGSGVQMDPDVDVQKEMEIGAAEVTTRDQERGAPPTETPTEPSRETETQPVSPVKAAHQSWADLLKKHSGTTPNGVPPRETLSKGSKGKRSPADVLKDLTVSYQGTLIRPRGLINNGNMCFMNAILQPLVHCPPFYNSFKKLSKELTHNFKAKSSLLSAILMFLNEFREDEPGRQLDLPDGDDEDAFAPEYVYDALRAMKKIESVKGRQEDAEEFLGFILDGLHEELLSLQKAHGPVKVNGHASEGDSSWVEVGRNNKTLVTRSTEIVESPISRIFGGRMRSVLKCPGRKDSITLQPFQALQLDITPANVRTIEDALINLTAAETLEGFTSPTKGNRGDAVKQNYLDSLPPILILHLKRFVYDNVSGTQKVHKHVEYPMALKILSEIMSPAARAASQYLEYRLFAVVYHHGRLAAGGHYTCDVQRQSGEWLHLDDAQISPCRPDDVVREQKDRQAYMLFYCRS